MSKRRRIEFQDGPGDYCSQCKDMMSFEGFLQLLSKDGFQHLSRREFEITATTGCSLCMFFCGASDARWKSENVLVLFLLPRTTTCDVLSGTPGEMMSALSQSGLACSELVGRSRPKTGGERHPQFSAKLFTLECKPPSWPRIIPAPMADDKHIIFQPILLPGSSSLVQSSDMQTRRRCSR